jgi:glycosyltransferase involved in cell wall biosynthesis
MIIWITWETQRRTEELAAALNTPLFKYLSNQTYLIRVLILSLKTSLKLTIARPKTVIVQNPSIVLASVACIMQTLLRYALVVDRHSNFKFETLDMKSLKYKIFHILSRFTVQRADLTIVTNEFLKEIVESWGGHGFVLPDKLPSLTQAEKIKLSGSRNIVFVCSYGEDEPLEEVIGAARSIDPSVVIHVTGDSRKLKRSVIDGAPPNIVFTGFLEEKTYQSYLCSCDFVMVLTTDDNLLACGAYEAVSLGKPLILSNKKTLREYFHKGGVYTDNEQSDIARAIQEAFGRRDVLEEEVNDLAAELRESWQLQFDQLKSLLDTF